LVLAMNKPATRIQRRKDKTRQILLDVALGLFYEKGIYWTKIEDITDRADIGKGTFYHYFETKEVLLQVLLQQGFDLLLTRMKEAAHAQTSKSRMLSSLVRAQLEFYLENPEFLLLFHQVRGFLQLKVLDVSALKHTYNAYLDRLGHLVGPVLSAKTTANGARHMAIALSAFTTGLLTHHVVAAQNGEMQLRRQKIQDQIERSIHGLTVGAAEGRK